MMIQQAQKEKSGAEMAPQWSYFHVHMMALFSYRSIRKGFYYFSQIWT